MVDTMKQYGRIKGQKGHDHEEERQDEGPIGYGYRGKDLRLDSTKPKKG